MIESFIRRYSDIEVLPLPQEHGVAAGVAPLSDTARLWPHRLRGKGHYVAKLRKHAPEAERAGNPARSDVGKQQLSLYREFEKNTLNQVEIDGIFQLRGTQLYRLPGDAPDLSQLKVVRAGLHLGENKKDRFEPNHALALALPVESFKHRMEIGSADNGLAYSYLRGETFSGEGDRGWLPVLYNGFALGWGKESKGTVKNFYPKRLRWLGR